MSDTPAQAEATAEFNRIRGRVCGLIESWNLDPKQERAAIQTFKSLTYDSEKTIRELLNNV